MLEYVRAALMATGLSTQNKELTSKYLPVSKKSKVVIFETHLLVIFLYFINFRATKTWLFLWIITI